MQKSDERERVWLKATERKRSKKQGSEDMSEYFATHGWRGGTTQYRYGIGLATHMLRVRVLPRAVALGKLLTPMCLCHQAV